MSYKSTEDEDVNYLKQDNIGKVIALGLTKLYEQHPDRPITYLAHWLLTYSSNLNKLNEIKKQEQLKQKNVASYQKQMDIKVSNEKKVKQQKKAHEDAYQSFLTKIVNHQYHDQLLLEQLPQFLEKYLKLTGVYIGQLNYPFKKITDDDQDHNAHLILDAPKCINYIGSSKSHSRLMLGKNLPLDKGVTGQVFSLNNVVTQVQSVQGQKKQPKKYIYIPDVVKNQKIHYFRIPKLGSYMAIPLVCKTYLLEKTFDEAFESKKHYLQELEQFKKQKQTKLQDVYKQLEDLRNKLKIFQDRNEQERAANIKEQITQAQQRKNQIEKQSMEEEQNHQYHSQNRQFVLCADTLGQDKEISIQNRQFLYNMVTKFQEEWKSTQLRLLKQNINHHLQYEKKIIKNGQDTHGQINKQLQIQLEITKQITTKYEGNEKKINYQILTLKHDKLKALLSKSYIKQLILHLKKYRVLKFPEILQNALYLIGYRKDVVNYPNRTHLNLKYVQNNLLKDELIEKILGYEYKGQKKQEYKSYEKVHTLLEIFQNIHENDVFYYNIGYGVLLKYLKNMLQLRILDVQIRHHNILEANTLRTEKIAQNQKNSQQKAKALESQRLSEQFNQEEWNRTYDEEHPLIDVPQELTEHIDNDL